MNSPILPEFELVRDFMPAHVICNCHKEPIKTKQVMPRTRSNRWGGTKGQVTPKSIVRSGRNSNSSEILCLSRLSGSFNPNETGYAPDKVNMVFFRHSRANNSEVKCPIWLEFKLVRDFMAVQLVTLEFEDEIRLKVKVLLHYKSMGKTFSIKGK